MFGSTVMRESRLSVAMQRIYINLDGRENQFFAALGHWPPEPPWIGHRSYPPRGQPQPFPSPSRAGDGGAARKTAAAQSRACSIRVMSLDKFPKLNGGRP